MADAPMTAAELLSKAEELYTSFNAAAVTVDTHADETLRSWRVHNDSDATFLRQVFYGVVRYKQLLNVLLAAFYARNSSTAGRDDVHLYTIFGYLILQRLEELSFPQFKRLVLSQDLQKMVPLLAFVFRGGDLAAYCRDEWLKLYDVPYVDGLLAGVAKFATESAELINTLEQQVYLSKKKEEERAAFWVNAASSGGDGSAKKLTAKFQPFNLTESKPRPPIPEEAPPPQFKAKPAPPASTQYERTQRQLEAKKAATRQQTAHKYADPAKQPFRLRVLERPSNTDTVRKELEAERMAELTRTRVPARPAPPPPDAPIRMNATAILREDARYKKRQEAEAAELARFESELRDALTFETWQAERRKEDHQRRLDEVEARRLEMAAAYEAAVAAKAANVEEKRGLVEAMREEAAALETQLREDASALEELNRQKREAVLATRDHARQAVERLELDKRAQAQALAADKAEASRRLAAERAADDSRKRDLIRQLRAMDAVKDDDLHRRDVFDPSTTVGLAGVGEPVHFLQEMSLVELRERLAAAVRRRAEETAETRATITARKQAREATLMSKAANISRIRDIAAAQAAARKQAAVTSKVVSDAAAATRREGKMVALEASLAARREAVLAEQDRLAEEEKRVKFNQSMLGASKEATEATRFLELRAGAERQLRDLQRATKAVSEEYEATKARAYAVRMTAVGGEQRAKADQIREYDASLAAMRAFDEAREAEEAARKRATVGAEALRTNDLRETWREHHPQLVKLGADGFGKQLPAATGGQVPLVWTHADPKYPPKARPSPTAVGLH